MLCIVIVPWNPIISEKREKFVAIFLKTLLVTDGHFTLIIVLGKFLIKSLNEPLVFAQKMSFQPASVNGLNHGPEKQGKLLG